MTATTDERSFEDLTSDAQEALEKAGTAFTKQANQLREGAVSQLREASNKIRQQVEGQNLDASAQEQLDRVLSRLEDMSAYLEKHTVEEIEQQASDAVKQNVWRNLIIALVVGLVIGYFLSRD